ETEASRVEPALGRAEQSNTSIIFGDQLILKLFRRLDIGVNPDLELTRCLTEKGFPHVPAVIGALEYTRPNGDLMTAGILTRFIPNATDAWVYTLDSLDRFFERVHSSINESLGSTAASAPAHLLSSANASILQLSEADPPAAVATLLGTYLESAR